MSKERDNNDPNSASYEELPEIDLDSWSSLFDLFVAKTVKVFEENPYLLDVEDAAILMFEQMTDEDKERFSFVNEFLLESNRLRGKIESSLDKKSWESLTKQESKRFRYDQLYDSGTPG